MHLSNVSSDSSMYVFKKGTQITVGWLILTWQLFTLELYCIGSQVLGIDTFGFLAYTMYFISAIKEASGSNECFDAKLTFHENQNWLGLC